MSSCPYEQGADNRKKKKYYKPSRVYLPPKEKHIQPLIEKLIDKMGFGAKPVFFKVRDKWESVVGEKIAAHTRVTAYKGKILKVLVDSSALLQELSVFRKSELKKKMVAGKNKFFVSEIRFKLGKIDT